MRTVSVVIPAYNAERTLGAVLGALSAQEPPVDEIVVVDDHSSDATREVAESFGVRVVTKTTPGYAGGARNAGWDVASGDVVVFLDADLIPASGWTAGLARALDEFPGAVINPALTFEPLTPWGWVAHLQWETPFLPHGRPREVRAVSSGCVAVPRDAPLRWDESFGGEDGVFSVDALAVGLRLVFDPRFSCLHDGGRETFRDLRRTQDRLAYSFARVAGVQREGRHKHVLARVPVYFALARLALVYRRVRPDAALRAKFVRLLPRLVVAEWLLGWSALKYSLRRPPLRGEDGAWFRKRD